MKAIRNTMIALAAAATLAPSIHAITPGHTNPDVLSPFTGTERRPTLAPKMTLLADGKSYAAVTADHKRIVKYDLATGKEVETMVDVANTRENRIESIDDFIIAPNEAQIILSTDINAVYRRSTTSVNYVYEVRSRLLRPLSTDHTPQRAPLFSPDGMNIAFVGTDNNIYLKKLNYWTEVAVTTDGEVNAVINGVPDWVYEEEFATSSSMTWSPDSRTLCFIRYDESKVPTYSFPLYAGYCNTNPDYFLYPGSFTYKYPVAGQPNSKVSVHSYDVDNRKLKEINLPSTVKIEYIPRIQFAYSDDRLMVTTLNRAQTRMEVYSVNPRSTVAKSILVEESQAWLNPQTYQQITWQPDGFVIFSGRSGYDHLYRYSYSGALMGAITSGNFDVTDYYGYDAAKGTHYCQSTCTGAINRVVSRIDRKGTMTNISPAEGTASAKFSTDMSTYVYTYNNATTPTVVTLKNSTNDKVVRTISDNTKGKYAEQWGHLPRREFFTMKSEGGIELNGFMIKPLDFDPSKKYPVIMYQYSGPGSQEVRNTWTIDWMNYFATQGYIIACVDGRGTGYRGHAFMDCVYKNLGHYETIDQIAAARHVASLPYVDASKIAMFGWSFGGYETLMSVTDPDSPYAAAVAVAPVTDWRFYDSIYAERYMLTPNENEAGYNSSAPLLRTSGVKCPLLIMWGTADDNVHPANTIEFVSRMQSQGNYCDLLLFPNMNHSINGCGVQALVYARMLDYFNKNLR